ncbi:MAG: hypothetical protein FWE36_07320 [Erysipelotrichales bacterium]|nr:hypothetical protein [Erysipelotrichales bacterium]
MFLKLFKHDFKESKQEMIIINILLLILTVGLAFAIRMQMETVLFMLGSVYFFFYFAYFGLLIRSLIKTLNNRLFTREGYLTLTLPVSIDKILLSKFLINFFWLAVAGITMMISAVLMIMILGGADFINFLAEFFTWLVDVSGPHFFVIAITIFINMLIGYVQIIAVILATLALMNIGKIKKNKTLVGIGILLIFIFATGMLSLILNDITNDLGLYFHEGSFIFGSRPSILSFPLFRVASLFITLASTIGAYFLTRYLIQNKLELENSL